MKKMLAAFAALSLCALSACNPGSPAQVDPCVSAPDVKQCEATRAATASSQGGDTNALLYGVGGYLLGSALSGGGGSSHSTHTKTIERHYVSPKPAPRPAYKPTSRPSYSSSYRSSYRSSSFRSGSFRRR